MVRRSFISLHIGHLLPPWDEYEEDDDIQMKEYFNYLCTNMKWEQRGYTGVALALEAGEQHGRVHIQGYVEHSQKRFSTLGKDFSCRDTAFSVVQDSKGAYEYCTGTGVHAGKPAFARYEFGSFKLHGDTAKADLKMLVGLVLDGATPSAIFKAHPYAWCVHRDRLLKFYEDKAKYGRKLTPRKGDAVVGFEEKGGR